MIAARDQLHAALAREGQRAGADQQHVLAVVEHGARELDRVAHALDGGDRARAQAVAAHDRGVHLDGAGARQARPAPGVEDRIVLELRTAACDGIQRRAARRQDREAGVRGRVAAGARGILAGAVGRAIAGAAVNDDQGLAAGSGGHGEAGPARH